MPQFGGHYLGIGRAYRFGFAQVWVPGEMAGRLGEFYGCGFGQVIYRIKRQ